jgi:hypothetical protein
MSGLTIPIILTVVALIAAFAAYRGIRRGGARFYTLERESMLRRAAFTLLGSVFLFLAAIALLVYNQQQFVSAGDGLDAGGESIAVTATSEPVLNAQPPTPSPTNPGGEEVAILPDGTILTLLEEEPVEANDFIWRNVRTVAREEGWVVEEFLKMGDCR